MNKKTCTKCNISFTPKTKKGVFKYCYSCSAIVRKENEKKGSKKYQEKKQIEKGYVVPDEDELIFYGYKNPLSKFEGGFGFKGVVRYSKDAQKMQCHFCGKLFKNVGIHAKFAHSLSSEQYKKKVGLSVGTALVGEATRIRLIKAHDNVPCYSHVGKTKEQIQEHMKKMSLKARKNERSGKKRTSQYSLERRNENGNCPAQLLDKIQKLAIKLGRTPYAKDYAKEYGSFQSIITVYGTWNEAVRLAGYITHTESRAVNVSRTYLLQEMIRFYKQHGRTPRTSDMKRGLLPYHQAYCKEFGTLNKARELANVPVLIQISKYRYDEVVLR